MLTGSSCRLVLVPLVVVDWFWLLPLVDLVVVFLKMTGCRRLVTGLYVKDGLLSCSNSSAHKVFFNKNQSFWQILVDFI